MAATLLVGLAGGSVILVWLAHDMSNRFHGHHTDYCPESHRRGEFRSCWVLDAQADHVLIQHADLDGNHYYLEIRCGNSADFFELPSSVARLAPEGYSASLIEGESDSIILDGSRVKLNSIAEPTF